MDYTIKHNQRDIELERVYIIAGAGQKGKRNTVLLEFSLRPSLREKEMESMMMDDIIDQDVKIGVQSLHP